MHERELREEVGGLASEAEGAGVDVGGVEGVEEGEAFAGSWGEDGEVGAVGDEGLEFGGGVDEGGVLGRLKLPEGTSERSTATGAEASEMRTRPPSLPALFSKRAKFLAWENFCSISA
jgi:hypothetical protein